MSSNVLSSWKRISAYTGFTERTLQRWERKFGFPVHRPAGKARSAVSALSTEIDAWLSAAPSLPQIQQTLVRYPGRARKQSDKQSDEVAIAETLVTENSPLPSTSTFMGDPCVAVYSEPDIGLPPELAKSLGQMTNLLGVLVEERAQMSQLRIQLEKTREAVARARRTLKPAPSPFSPINLKSSLR